MTPLVRASGVAIAGRLEPSDLQLEAGSMTALIGPNGGGKTSLLRALAAVEGIEGEVLLDGEPLRSAAPARRSRLIAFVPASRDLQWPIAARDVIALGPGRPSAALAERMVAAFELEPLLDWPMNRLSTGERARVLLARAFASGARLLLLDEPLSNLDPYWVIRTLQLLRDYATEGRCALVSVHDLAQLEAFDRALLVAGGRLLEDRAPAAMLASEALAEAFRIRRSDGGWQVSP